MELDEQVEVQNNENNQQSDVHSYPVPIRLKHPLWSVRKGIYQQILYYLKNLSSPTQQILISGTIFTIETLLPYFQNLIQQKHASVLLKGLQCVEQILIFQKRLSGKHCIKTLIDKGIEYFPLLSQQKKAILQKFLDILQLCKIESGFLKNKLNLPHEKSVMYVIQVIGVLNIRLLKNSLVSLSKKHQKKCVRQLAAQIAEQLEPELNQTNQILQNTGQNEKNKISSKPNFGDNASKSQSSKLTIEKLSLYQQLASKKQQQYSNELLQKIDSIIEEYSVAKLPSFSHVLRLMIDDNNHIINVNAIKCLIKIFISQRTDSLKKDTLIPQSFPLLFIFSKFKSHKTHPINCLLLSLAQAILQSSSNRVNDLLQAISQGLHSAGSKANVKFGCSLTFFRIISLVYQNEDLYICTANDNMQSINQDLSEKFSLFSKLKFTKNQLKLIQKIVSNLQKDKKYDTQIYLIKYAIGLDFNNQVDEGSLKQLPMTTKSNSIRQYESSKTIDRQPKIKSQKVQMNLQGNKRKDTKAKTLANDKIIPLNTILKSSNSSQKFSVINLEECLNSIIKCVNGKSLNMKNVKDLIQRSIEQFYTCVREKRFEMFYLCELLQRFITSYEPNQKTIQCISEYLINLLKIISLMKPLAIESAQSKQINKNNVSQLLLVTLCKLAISEQVQQVMQNINKNYGYEVIFESLKNLFIQNSENKIKKKNKKYLLQWLESNTPSMFLNNQFYKLTESIKDKKGEKQKSTHSLSGENQKLQKITSRDSFEKNEDLYENHPKSNKQSRLQNIKLYSNEEMIERNNFQVKQSHRVNFDLKQSRKFQELQNINLSKIENNTESNYDDYEYMEKSSFHQNLQEQLNQIKTYRTYDEEQISVTQKEYEQDRSREYLKNLKIENFKKKQNDEVAKILQSPFKKNQQIQSSHEQQEEQQKQSNQYQQILALSKRLYSFKQDTQQVNQDNMKLNEEDQYLKKFQSVEKRRIEREKQRRDFMHNKKVQLQTIIKNNSQNQENHSEIQDHSDLNLDNSKSNVVHENQYNTNNYSSNQPNHLEQNQSISNQKYSPYFNQSTIKPSIKSTHQIQQSTIRQSEVSNKKFQQSPNKLQQSVSKPQEDSSILSTNSAGSFKYKLLNHQKVSYMLKSTTNPYPHLRTLVLIPFKSSPKKHNFLQQLLHFFTNQVQFKMPQPYTSLTLLTILMFSQIKEDKSLIQPLQSLYQLVAKQSTTNEFLRTILSLFHTVIEETLVGNRKFLITILLKSMIRMLPFVEDGTGLMRDIQQFYQIGEMVYFEMFQDEYRQIRSCLEGEVTLIVEKGFQQEGENLRSIVEGWLSTQWKKAVLGSLEEFQNQHSQVHNELEQNAQEHSQTQKFNQDQEQSYHRYESYI